VKETSLAIFPSPLKRKEGTHSPFVLCHGLLSSHKEMKKTFLPWVFLADRRLSPEFVLPIGGGTFSFLFDLPCVIKESLSTSFPASHVNERPFPFFPPPFSKPSFYGGIIEGEISGPVFFSFFSFPSPGQISYSFSFFDLFSSPRKGGRASLPEILILPLHIARSRMDRLSPLFVLLD